MRFHVMQNIRIWNSIFALFPSYLPCTGGPPVHTGARVGVCNSLWGHCSQLHMHLTADPKDQVRPSHSEWEAHPGHRVDLLPLLVALPHRQHVASMSHILFLQVQEHILPRIGRNADHFSLLLTKLFCLVLRLHGLCVQKVKWKKRKWQHNNWLASYTVFIANATTSQ